jgi:hypothetical protein
MGRTENCIAQSEREFRGLAGTTEGKAVGQFPVARTNRANRRLLEPFAFSDYGPLVA